MTLYDILMQDRQEYSSKDFDIVWGIYIDDCGSWKDGIGFHKYNAENEQNPEESYLYWLSCINGVIASYNSIITLFSRGLVRLPEDILEAAEREKEEYIEMRNEIISDIIETRKEVISIVTGNN